ncbi:MAG: dihydrofolate reductase family protein [Candidatus Promineifilaceae bacterium]|nr:dihydrofolate reductase family protein [Candidatus Promineifilaceae bacterium]
MQDGVQRLFPHPVQDRPLENVYLDHDLRRQRGAAEGAYVYANFVASLDGRIAIPHPSRPGMKVPEAVANERDWRLFQELAAQADMIISTGRYLRDWADGRAQEILQVDDPRFADLRAWREEQGLPPQPDMAIVSGSLRFPIPDVLTAGGRNVVVYTTAEPDPERVEEIEAQAGEVVVAGDEEGVDGARMVQDMTARGYRTIYSSAGPKILHMLVSGGVLDRLYLTLAPRLLGGDPYSTLIEGELFSPAVDMELFSLYQDTHALESLGQLFLAYDRLRS